MKYRVYVTYEDGAFAGFVILTIDDLADILQTMNGINTITVVKIK